MKGIGGGGRRFQMDKSLLEFWIVSKHVFRNIPFIKFPNECRTRWCLRQMEQLLSSYVCSTSMTLSKFGDTAIQEKVESLKQNENIFSRDLPDAACSSCQNVDKIFDRNKPWHDLEIELWKRYFLEFWIWACAVDKEAGQRIQSICWPHHSCLTLMMTRTTQRRKEMPNDKMARIL